MLFCNISGFGVGIDYPQEFDGLNLNPQEFDCLDLNPQPLSLSLSMVVI